MRALVMSLMAFSLIVGTAAMAAEGGDKDTTATTDASAPSSIGPGSDPSACSERFGQRPILSQGSSGSGDKQFQYPKFRSVTN